MSQCLNPRRRNKYIYKRKKGEELGLRTKRCTQHAHKMRIHTQGLQEQGCGMGEGVEAKEKRERESEQEPKRKKRIKTAEKVKNGQAKIMPDQQFART